MHFVIGGAFNGKRAWVKNLYRETGECCWISAYKNDSLPENVTDFNHQIVILEGIEIWLKKLAETYSANMCRDLWKKGLEHWLNWEKDQENRTLVVMGTDITKGIVPIEVENRVWRDVTGWVYQDIAAKAMRVDVVWYGLNQTIK